MDWKLFLTTFATIFIAELGDKTQFAALGISSQSKNTLSVLLAVVLALSCAGSLGVIAGRFLGNFINPTYLKYCASLLFIAMGVVIFFRGE